MKIGIISRKPDIYSTQRLVQASIEHGHLAQVIDPLACYMNITSGNPEVHYKGEVLTGYNAIIPRIGASVTFYGTAVVRQFETMGAYSCNSSIAITRSRDKLRAHQILSRHGIGMPLTAFAHSTMKTNDLISLVGTPPLIIKLLQGTQGKGVVLAETFKAAESVIDAFRNLDAHFLVQQYIEEAGGSDIRCIVIGDKVVASMKRTAMTGEFRSNLHRGGHGEVVKITALERKTAIKAAKVLGIRVGGVDMLRSNDGPKVMEVNSSPGLEGIEKTTNTDIASLIVKFLEKELTLNRKKEL